jgi:TPR repeat protein
MKPTQILRLSFVSLILVMAISVSQSVNGKTPDFNDILKSAQKGDPNAQAILGYMYQEGYGVAQDYKEAIKWYRKAAEQGEAHAQCFLGMIYATNDQGIDQDYHEALKWFKKSAEQGFVIAQYKLGVMYAKGIGVTQDYQEAFKWSTKAAAQGDAESQCLVGVMYDAGWGVTQDYQESIKWFKKAAEKGYAAGQYLLGGAYYYGKGVAKDYQQAFKWYQKAAEQSYASAQCKLGVMYYSGDGITQDSQESIKWYRKAAEQGYADAQLHLGLMYAEGNGVAEDYVEAYKWLILATAQGDQIIVAQGHEIAVKVKGLLKQKMSTQQIAESQRLAKEFRPKINNTTAKNSTTPTQGDKVATSGTGFFITTNGYIVTSYHVVKDAAKVRLVTNQGIKIAVVVKSDSTNDIAILKAENAQYVSLPIKSSMGVKLGADVFTVGFPNVQLQGFEPKYTKGNISSLSGIQDDPRHFQISTPVQPGNSGGPLIDTMGNVIGIVVAKISDVEALEATGSIPQNVNYAIKSSFALALLESLPEASQNLKPPLQKERNPADIVDEAQKSVVLILCY